MSDFEQWWRETNQFGGYDSIQLAKNAYLAGQAASEQRVKELEEALKVALEQFNRCADLKDMLKAKCAELEREQWFNEAKHYCTKSDHLFEELTALKAQAGEPVKFLCEGTRYKVSRDAYHGTGCQILGLPDELQGEWVALVEATDNCHMKLVTPSTPAAEPDTKCQHKFEDDGDNLQIVCRYCGERHDVDLSLTPEEANAIVDDPALGAFFKLDDEAMALITAPTIKDIAEVAADLTSTPAAERRVPEWQPIETAPKTGETILGFDPAWYDLPALMFWNGDRDRWQFFQIDDQIRPTHWMPLPAAPKEQGK